MDADTRSKRFAIFAVILPLALVGAGLIATGAGSVENSPLSFFSSFGGVFFVTFFIVQNLKQRFPAERFGLEPWPLASGAAMLAFSCVTAAMSPESAMVLVLGAAIPPAVVAGVLGYALARAMLPGVELPVSHAPAPPDVLRHHVAADHTPVWSGRAPAHGRRVYLWIPIYGLIALGLCASLLLSDGSSQSKVAVATAGAFLFVPQIAALVFSIKSAQVRVTVGPAGLMLRTGVTGRVALAVDLVNIESAWHTIAPKPNLLTSYGKRSSERRLAYLTREGPALMVRLTDGSDVVVSLDEPGEVAGVLNDLLDRRAAEFAC